MSLQSSFVAVLQSVCPRVFPDVAPFDTQRPYITWQQVGGDEPSYTENALPNTENALIQVNIWSDTRLEAINTAKAAKAALTLTNTLQARATGAFVATCDEDLKRYGTRQDFTVWAPS